MYKRLMILLVGIVSLPGMQFICAGEDAPLPPPPPPPVAPTIPDVPAAPATPPAETETGTAAPADRKEHTPDTEGTPGRIRGGRVNIRSGPSTRFEIVVTLNPESPVTVFGKKGDWYQIAYPQQQYCYVHQRHIEGSITDIPPDGLLRSIIGEKVTVRVRPWNKSTPVGNLKQGDLVTIVGIRGQWAKIKPPAIARAWVFGKYVKTAQEVTDDPKNLTEHAPPPATGQSAAKASRKRKSDLAKLAEAEKKKYYEALLKRNEEARKAHLAAIQKVVSDIDAKLKAIEEEGKAAQVPAEPEQPPATPATASPEPYKPGEQDMGGFTGWIEYIGRVGKRPAAFRLVKGGEVLFLLRSSQYNLADYVNKRVAVDGDVEPAPGFQANVMIVNSMRLLGEPPIPVRQQKIEIRRPYVPGTNESRSAPVIDVSTSGTAPEHNTETTVTIVENTGSSTKKKGELPVIVNETEVAPSSDKVPEKVFEPGE